MNKRPHQTNFGLWNISFGFFGIQIGFALQNANASRIFQSLGTPLDDLGLMWIAAPLTGLLVQPIIGYYSDRTWGPLGRRRPYFLAGAILSTLALFFMPNAPVIWAAAITLWLLDGSLNISMEPFRAFVGDMLGKDQRPAGYAFQTGFIGAGAVVASLAPYLLERIGVANVAAPGAVPDTVRYGFYLGGILLLAAVAWTVISTREYPPATLAAFEDGGAPDQVPGTSDAIVAPRAWAWWIVGGGAAAAAAWAANLSREAYFVAVLLVVFGVGQLIARRLVRAGRTDGLLVQIMSDLVTMPPTMRKLALVQFFTWGALIIMWIYMTPVVAQYVFGATDPASPGFNQAGNWVGVLFAIYSGVATLAAFALPAIARRIGPARTHLICLLAGAAAYASLLVIRDSQALIVPMIGVGIAWASILTMPYVILAGVLPPEKLGIYMGIFNFFIVLPQLLVSTIMGGVIRAFFPTEPIWTMLVAATVMAIAALAMLRIGDPEPTRPRRPALA
ncbi:MAG: MFS transporter [Sphingomonas sp. 28-66-16]|nr:MAG: MFS transporter [Sphingomonas sp. 28-66-16]